MLEKMRREYPVEVIGVHVPDFGFEDQEHVERKLSQTDIEFPVALDHSHRTLNSFGGKYAPRNVLVCDGRVEWLGSDLEEAERKLAEILDRNHLEVAEEKPGLEKKEFGYRKPEGLGVENFTGEKEFTEPEKMKPDTVYLKGNWVQNSDHLESKDGTMRIHFTGSELHVAAAGKLKDIGLRSSGSSLNHQDAGSDVRVEDSSYLRVNNPGTFSIVESAHGSLDLEMSPEKGVRIYGLFHD